MNKQAKTARSLRKKLIRLAHDHPQQRAAAIEALAKMGITLVAKGDKMPADLLEKFKGKDDKKASSDKVAVKPETEDFARWVMSTQAPMSPNEVESFVNRQLNIKTSAPVKKRGGTRFQRGDSVLINAKKHKSAKFERSNYDRFDGKTGTVTEVDGMDAMVAFKGERADVRFPGAQATRGVGIYKYTKPYTITGSAKIEMIYNAGGKSTPDAVVTVDAYVGRGSGTEKRSANYYTGHVTFAAMGGKGWYFKGFPQQRMEINPQSEAGYQARTFNPALGQVLYIGIFNSRPSTWKSELKKMDDAVEAEAAAG